MPHQQTDPVLPDRISELLLQKGETVAVAESVTAGHLQVAFSLAKNAMDFFQGGLTVYNVGQKTRHLQVDPIHALSCNCVSEQVAAQMARHVTELFLSDWGIAITGYASPVPEKDVQRLFACYAIYSVQSGLTVGTVFAENTSPPEVRRVYTDHVIKHFGELLEK